MKIIKPIEFIDIQKPIVFYRPITDDQGKIVRDMAITDDCILYDYNEITNNE